MLRKRMVVLSLLAGLLGVLAVPARAIKVCHDYTFYRVTALVEGKSRDSNTTSADTLRQYLRSQGYQLKFTTTMRKGDAAPDIQKELKLGDVVFMGAGHSGYVGGVGIDHFIIVEGTSRNNVTYKPGEWPYAPLPGGKAGGLHVSHTLKRMRESLFTLNPITVEVWRRDHLELAGVWRDNGGNEYRISKYGGKYSVTYLKVNDFLKSCHFTVGEEGGRNFTPVPGKANTFEGEIKWRSQNKNDPHYPQWRKSVITLNGDKLTITSCSYPQWERLRRS
jgi:hypothetical protein